MSEAEDTELALIYPPEKSMSGRNSVYQFCDERQQQVAYCVCLHTLKNIENGTMAKDQFVECQRAYTHDNCPAKVMRAQEISAGQALFFIERPRHVTEYPTARKLSDGAVSSGKFDMSDPSYARGWAIGGREGYSTDKPTPRNKPTRNIGPVKKSGYVEASMADALTEMVKDDKKPKSEPVVEQPKPAVQATPSTSTRPLPGESMADFIKRKASLQGKAK